VLVVLVFSTNLVGTIIEPFFDALRDFVVA